MDRRSMFRVLAVPALGSVPLLDQPQRLTPFIPESGPLPPILPAWLREAIVGKSQYPGYIHATHFLALADEVERLRHAVRSIVEIELKRPSSPSGLRRG